MWAWGGGRINQKEISVVLRKRDLCYPRRTESCSWKTKHVLIYSSNSSGLFLPDKPNHPDGRDPGQPANEVPFCTHIPIFRWVNSQFVSRCNENRTCCRRVPHGKAGEKPGSMATLSVLELDPEPLITTPVSDKQLKCIKKTHNNKAVYRYRIRKRE